MTTAFEASPLVDPRDLARHVGSGPRYTSYPPATEFTGEFTGEHAARELSRVCDARAGQPISLYLHIPFCPSLCWYCGCNVVVTRRKERGDAYVEMLCRELELVAASGLAGRPLADISLGGGSPNFLSARTLTGLLGAVRRLFAVSSATELSVELDPRETTPQQVEALAGAGLTRFSVGVQDFDPDVQKAIHRYQSVEQTRALIERARGLGVSRLNVDLVYGLPGQTVASFGRTLDEIVALAPRRIALFGYAHMPHLRPHQKLVERGGELPGIPLRAELFAAAAERLRDAGFVRVGLDHFAMPDDELAVAARTGRLRRNFQGYVAESADCLIGCGATGISDTGTAYWQNHPTVDAWSAAVESGALPVARGFSLSRDDLLRRHVIERIMCDGHVDFAAIDSAWDIEFEDYFAGALSELEREQGALATVDAERRRLELTPLGCYLPRNVGRAFDAYFEPPRPGGRSLSLTL